MKLNKTTRDAILNAALKKAGIPDREAAIRSRYAAWAETVRLRYVTTDIDAAIEEAKRIIKPAELVNSSYRVNDSATNVMRVNVAGQSRRIYFNGSVGSDTIGVKSVYKRVPNDGSVVVLSGPTAEQLYSIDHDAKTVADDREQLTVSLRAVLDSVTTDKRLVEVWPEAVAFIPAAERAASPQLPALPIADLNRLIGLP